MTNSNEITRDDLIQIITNLCKVFKENSDYLSKLDTEIGDGDHGFSMATGFKAIENRIDSFSSLTIGELLKTSGFELIKSIGGAAGIVFGTFFTGQATYYENHLVGNSSLGVADLSNMFNEALSQIKKRGNAKPGDKTMVDALEPALLDLLASAENDYSLKQAFQNATEKAKEGLENTRNMVSKRGRSKNLGERSIGYIDAGAMSTYLIFKTYSDYFNKT